MGITKYTGIITTEFTVIINTKYTVLITTKYTVDFNTKYTFLITPITPYRVYIHSSGQPYAEVISKVLFFNIT